MDKVYTSLVFSGFQIHMFYSKQHVSPWTPSGAFRRTRLASVPPLDPAETERPRQSYGTNQFVHAFLQIWVNIYSNELDCSS